MRSLLRVALALMMALTVVGSALVAPTTNVTADSPESGAYVMLPVVQNGDGVTSLIAMQNTNAFSERALVTFYPSGKQFLTGIIPPKASFLLPNSVIPDGVSSATVDTIAYIPTFTAVSPDFANLPIYWPPSIAVTAFNNLGGSQGLLLGVGLDVATQQGLVNPQDLCANANFQAFQVNYFPQFPCRNFFPGSAPATTQPTGFVWSFNLDITNVSYVYLTSAATGAVAGYFTETYSRLGDYLGVPGFDLLSPGLAVVVHRTDQTGPRVSEYEGIPFQNTSYTTTVPPGITPLGGNANGYPVGGGFLPSGQVNPQATGFIGQAGYTVFAPLVMKNYHGWNTRVWFMNYNRNNQMVVTYYDQAGNPVFEETGYALGTARTTAITGAGLPDGFVGTAWVATTRYNAVVVDEYRDNPPMMMSYRAEPARTALSLNTINTITGNYNNFAAPFPTGTIANFSGTAPFNTAPLVMSKYHGYNTGFAVLNPNAYEVRVILNFRRENGGEQYVVSDRIPPRGMTPFYDSAVSNLPENFVGNVQVVAEYSPGVPAGVVAVVNTVNYIRGFADAYNMVDNVFDLAAENDLPFVTKGFQGYNSGIAIMNMNTNPGRLNGNFDVYTATGILERTVFQVDSLNTATVYMPNMYQVPNGFVGGAAAYVVQTNQAPSPVYGVAPPTYVTGTSTVNANIIQNTIGGYTPTGLTTPVNAQFVTPSAGTGIAAVVNNVNYNGVGDQLGQYGGFPVGGVFTGAGLGGYGASGMIGQVKNCTIGVGIPGLPVFVFNSSTVPVGVSPYTWLNGQIPVNAPSGCAQAAGVLPFNPALQQAFGTGNFVGSGLTGSSLNSANSNGTTQINGTVTAFVPATPAQSGVLQITVQNGQVASFTIPAGTVLSNFAQGGVGPFPGGQSITSGLSGTFNITLANGQLVALATGSNPTFGGAGLANSTLPAGFRAGLGTTTFITFTDQNGQYNLDGLPPGEYYIQVGGFSAACSPIGATGAATLPQDSSFSYVAFNNSEVDKVILNGNGVTTAPIFCLTPVGPVYEIGVVSGPNGPVNGATVTAETICPSFNGAIPGGFGAPASLGGPADPATTTLAAFGIANTSTTSTFQAFNGLTNVVTSPFQTSSGVGINTPASSGTTSVTVPGTTFTVPAGAGGYVLALPFFGNYKKTVQAAGFSPQVFITVDCAKVNITNISLGTGSATTSTATGPTLAATAGAVGSASVTLTATFSATQTLTGGTVFSPTNVLFYEVVSGTNQLRSVVAVATPGTSTTATTTLTGQGPAGTVRTFIAQLLNGAGQASAFGTTATVVVP